MKYTQEVEAVQYDGTVKSVKKFLGIKDAATDDSQDVLFVTQDEGNPDSKIWKAVKDDFIVKTDLGFIVYKPERFAKTFTEVAKTSK